MKASLRRESLELFRKALEAEFFEELDHAQENLAVAKHRLNFSRESLELFRKRLEAEFLWSLRKSREAENPHGGGFSSVFRGEVKATLRYESKLR